MKVHLKIGDFEFVEKDVETMLEAIDFYYETKAHFSAGDGVTDKELNMVLDHMLRGETVKGGIEIWARMNDTQKLIVNTLKKATKRINKSIKE